MASAKNMLRPYRVEITPAAWKQVAHLPQDAYVALQEWLRTVAERVSVERGSLTGSRAESPSPGDCSFTWGDLSARYEVDTERQVVRLTELARAHHRPLARAAGTDGDRTSE